MERLRAAAGAGCLTLEELADRLEAAGGARTRDELAALTRDLPAEHGAAFARATPVAGHENRLFGDVRRAGEWLVPARSRWRSTFGDIELDLREAHVAATDVTIDARTIFGDVDLLVPEGVVVEIRSRVVLGDVIQDAAQAAPFGAPRIVLEGGTVFGDVRVRGKRLREALLERVGLRRRLPR